jgi:hypothetical protein
MVEVARISVSRYHELPLWNPFECGGVPLWDNPQGVAGAPLMWLTFVFGTTRTIEIWYVVHSAIGVVCMWALARLELRMSTPASLVAAASWAFAGVHTNHFVGGHVIWVCHLYFPLALLLWRRAESDLWAAVGTGLIAAVTIYEGGTYPLPYLAVLLGVETLLRVWPPRRLLRILEASVVVLLVAFFVGAARFLPVLDQLLHHHRDLGPDTDAMKWATLKDIFLAREHARAVDGQNYVWPEFGDYLGPIVLSFGAIGLLLVRGGERWLLVLYAFSFALMCGRFAEHAPWSFLNTYVYPFKQMRVPSRFVVVTTLFISVFAGFAVDRIPRLFRRLRSGRGDALPAAVFALAMVGVGDEMSVGIMRLTDIRAWSVAAFSGAPQLLDAPSRPKLYYGGAWTAPFLDAPHLNTPDLGCWEEWAFERDAPLWLGDLPQARPFTNNITIALVDRTPNTFTVDLNANGAGRIVLNSTYDRGWRSDQGEVVEQGKMLAVDVPAGKYTLHVHYWPHGLTVGFILSGVSIVGLAALFVVSRLRRRRAVDGASVAA